MILSKKCHWRKKTYYSKWDNFILAWNIKSLSLLLSVGPRLANLRFFNESSVTQLWKQLIWVSNISVHAYAISWFSQFPFTTALWNDDKDFPRYKNEEIQLIKKIFLFHLLIIHAKILVLLIMGTLTIYLRL